MKTFIKENFAVVLAFALPIALILFVAASTYVPSLFLSTNYNFVYITCGDSRTYYPNCEQYFNEQYKVEKGKLVELSSTKTAGFVDERTPGTEEPAYTIRFFLHDTEKDESREVTLAEVQQYELSDLLTSPDGVSVTNRNERGADFIFFSGGSERGFYLVKGSSKTRINLVATVDSYYYRNFHFVGWVLPGRQ
jgi:hypothetical protein